MPYLMPEDQRDRALLQRFGIELRRCRLAAGLSQVALAERSGVSQSTISRLEDGRIDDRHEPVVAEDFFGFLLGSE